MLPVSFPALVPAHPRRAALMLVGAVLTSAVLTVPAAAPAERPNVVLVFCDDLGYADVGCYGARGISTPNLDRLAREGVRFTDFYVPQAVCSASRAALLTGCYPNRVGIFGALGPQSPLGLHPRETTLAEVLKGRGYATALFGKWHLGRPPELLPTRQGFDEYFGLPYSNDMWPRHPTGGSNYPLLPLLEGEQVKELMPDQAQLTTWYTERAVQFIARHRDRPFFVYLAHSMPHVPLFVSDKFRGRSPRGLYGDVIMELDWSVGQILAALQQHGLDERTLLIFTSDNGPWLVYGDHAGSALPLREGKATTFDGGHRVPCLMRWPGRIPAGRECRELATSMDLWPTLARLAGAQLPAPGALDGKDIWPLMAGQPGAKTPHEAFFYYWGRHLQAVRSGPWKLHFPHGYPSPDPPGAGGKPGKHVNRKTDLALFNLDADIGETRDLAAAHPDVVARLQRLADQARDDLGDSALRRTGRHMRPPGRASASRAAPIPLLEGAMTLFASEASLLGPSLRWDEAQQALGGWSRPEDRASWEFATGKGGTFLVEVLLSAPAGGGELVLAFGDQSLSVKTDASDGPQPFLSRHLGQVRFPKDGRQTLSVAAKPGAGTERLRLRAVTLWPMPTP